MFCFYIKLEKSLYLGVLVLNLCLWKCVQITHPNMCTYFYKESFISLLNITKKPKHSKISWCRPLKHPSLALLTGLVIYCVPELKWTFVYPHPFLAASFILFHSNYSWHVADSISEQQIPLLGSSTQNNLSFLSTVS